MNELCWLVFEDDRRAEECLKRIETMFDGKLAQGDTVETYANAKQAEVAKYIRRNIKQAKELQKNGNEQ